MPREPIPSQKRTSKKKAGKTRAEAVSFTLGEVKELVDRLYSRREDAGLARATAVNMFHALATAKAKRVIDDVVRRFEDELVRLQKESDYDVKSFDFEAVQKKAEEEIEKFRCYTIYVQNEGYQALERRVSIVDFINSK
jgi:hypothetical protein